MYPAVGGVTACAAGAPAAGEAPSGDGPDLQAVGPCEEGVVQERGEFVDAGAGLRVVGPQLPEQLHGGRVRKKASRSRGSAAR
jgi:hypothetical protein